MDIRRVLVVDDQDEIRDLVSLVLGDLAGWTIEAVDGVAAMVEAGPRFAPDVVLLDCWLGHDSGEEAARQLRGAPWFDRAALLFFTGSAALDDRARHRALGAGTIAKPFDPTALAAQIVAEVARLG